MCNNQESFAFLTTTFTSLHGVPDPLYGHKVLLLEYTVVVAQQCRSLHALYVWVNEGGGGVVAVIEAKANCAGTSIICILY
jgi:hypothetical protein